jgi:soluble lytic murein transglycosylase-like protein
MSKTKMQAAELLGHGYSPAHVCGNLKITGAALKAWRRELAFRAVVSEARIRAMATWKATRNGTAGLPADIVTTKEHSRLLAQLAKRSMTPRRNRGPRR